MGRAVIGRVVNEPVLPMAAPIKDAAGRVLAVLVGITGLNSPGFLDAIHQGRIGETGGYLLISVQEWLFIAATKPELILQPTAMLGVNPLHDRALAGFRGSGITVNAQGVEELAAFALGGGQRWFCSRPPAYRGSLRFVGAHQDLDAARRNGYNPSHGFTIADHASTALPN